MDNNDIFTTLEQLGITCIVRNDNIYFLELEDEAFMRIYQGQRSLPLESFKANTFYNIYSQKNNKMIRIYLKNPRNNGVINKDELILSHVDFFDGPNDYSIDLEQGLNPKMKLQYRYKENDEIVDNKELIIETNGNLLFTEEQKGKEYTFASYDVDKDNNESYISTIMEELNTNKMVSIFLEYYGKYQKGLLDTVNNFKEIAKKVENKRTIHHE